MQRHSRLARRGKWLGLAIDGKRTAVNTRAQQRFDEDVSLRRQRGNKRNAELPLIDYVLHAEQAVVEGDLPILEANVRYGKQRRLAIRRGRLLRELLDQIGEIE